jgi:hypothetical protein
MKYKKAKGLGPEKIKETRDLGLKNFRWFGRNYLYSTWKKCFLSLK